MREPTGVAVDSSGKLYVADQLNDAIRKAATLADVKEQLAKHFLDAYCRKNRAKPK